MGRGPYLAVSGSSGWMLLSLAYPSEPSMGLPMGLGSASRGLEDGTSTGPLRRGGSDTGAAGTPIACMGALRLTAPDWALREAWFKACLVVATPPLSLGEGTMFPRLLIVLLACTHTTNSTHTGDPQA